MPPIAVTTPIADHRLTCDEAIVEPFALNRVTALAVTRVRDDERIQVTDLEPHLTVPLRPRGTAVLHEPDDFAAYVLRLADTNEDDPATTLWADLDNRRVTAVFNDHTDGGGAGWRDHTAVFQVKVDPDWSAWTGSSGKLVSQTEFAEFLEDHMHALVEPAAADLLEVVTTFKALRRVTYRSATRLSSGDLQFAYDQETTTQAGRKGDVEVPSQFTLRLAPFAGLPVVDVLARLRWRIDEAGGLRIGYVLHRRDLVERDAFNQLVRIIGARVSVGDEGLPLYTGQAPSALHAR